MTTPYARIRPKHPASITGTELDALPVRDIEATGDTYEHAREQLDQQVPEGWQLLGISTWPPTG